MRGHSSTDKGELRTSVSESNSCFCLLYILREFETECQGINQKNISFTLSTFYYVVYVVYMFVLLWQTSSVTLFARESCLFYKAAPNYYSRKTFKFQSKGII